MTGTRNPTCDRVPGAHDPVKSADAGARRGPDSHRVAVGHDPVGRDVKDQRTGERTNPTPTAPVDHSPE